MVLAVLKSGYVQIQLSRLPSYWPWKNFSFGGLIPAPKIFGPHRRHVVGDRGGYNCKPNKKSRIQKFRTIVVESLTALCAYGKQDENTKTKSPHFV